jgi:hypothetical protein
MMQPTIPGLFSSELLTEAANIVAGDRNKTHGDKERSFAAIAEFWNTYLSFRKDRPINPQISPADVAQMMVLLKIARAIQGTPVRDHFLDAAGYAAIAGELNEANFKSQS